MARSSACWAPTVRARRRWSSCCWASSERRAARPGCWACPAGDRAGRQRVGYLPENLRIPRHHTALSALELYGQMSGLSRSEIRRRRGPLLESVDLADRAKDSVKKYSKGMVQRLGLAIALLHEPQLVFLDEPTDGLDPAGRAEVRQTLVRLKEAGKTIFLNSHLLQEVEQVCDRVAILDQGTAQGHWNSRGTGPDRGRRTSRSS